MCPTPSVTRPNSLFSLDQVLPIVVPCCDKGVFIDDKPPRNNSSDSHSPSSPDSGFSSEDGGSSPLRFERSRPLPSALRKKRSSVSSRKSVRFADSLGLDLEKMEYFSPDEEILFGQTMPNIPSCKPVASTSAVSYHLFPTNFVYRSESESIRRTRLARVNISSLRTTRAGHLTGQINVLNLAYDKKVTVRYTMDGWLTHYELPASFSHKLLQNEDIDAFSFLLTIPHQSSTRCEMCVSFEFSDGIFWDNNEGVNYLLEWVAREEKSLHCMRHLTYFPVFLLPIFFHNSLVMMMMISSLQSAIFPLDPFGNSPVTTPS